MYHFSTDFHHIPFESSAYHPICFAANRVDDPPPPELFLTDMTEFSPEFSTEKRFTDTTMCFCM